MGCVFVPPFGLWVFCGTCVISLFRGENFVNVPLSSGLAPSMYLPPMAFSSIDCWPVTTPIWSLILWPPLTFSLERLLGVLYTEGCNSGVGLCYWQQSICCLKPCATGLGGCLPLSDVLQTLVSSWPLSFLLVNFRLWFICLVVCYVVKLERALCWMYVGGCEEVGW